MTRPTIQKQIRLFERAALDDLTNQGKEEVKEYITKICNDDKLTRAHIEAIACGLLLKE